MDINKHFIYTIKDSYYEDFPDPYLKNNKGQTRPNYYVFEGNDKEILWLIPLSTKIEKFERIIKKRESQGKSCDVAYVCKVGSRKQAFVISDMFPVTKEYIQGEYQLNQTPYRVAIEKDIQAIEMKAIKIKELIDRGVKFVPTQPNVKIIENQLIQRLDKNPELVEDPNRVKIESAASEELIEQQRKQERRKAFLRSQKRER